MTSPLSVDPVCLDVAIDHRIIKLLKPVDTPSESQDSTHVSLLEACGRRLKKPKDEIKVTMQLAGPPTTGGILVALQQPRDKHPYDKGVEEVIKTCETLRALQELFRVASCGTLEVGENVSVIDLLPYISQDRMKSMKAKELKEAFLSTTHVFGRKKPDILLCCAKISRQCGDVCDESMGEAREFEHNGLGKTFEEGVTLDFRDETDNWVRIERVNGFHPSYAVNRHPYASCFRQLQLLTVAEACGRYRGDWEEETWMSSLRSACANQVKQIQAEARSSLESQQHLSPLSKYGEMYSDVLDKAKDAIESLPDSVLSYDDLLGRKLSTLCNNANLILRKMSALSSRKSSDWYREENDNAVRTTVDKTRRFTAHVPRQLGNLKLRYIARRYVNSLHQRVAGMTNLPSPDDLNTMAHCFLSTARDLEALLGKLLEPEETTYIPGIGLDPLSELNDRLEALKISR